MKRESHPLDDFFKESLKELKVEPSPHLRDRFLQEASQPVNGSGSKWWNSTGYWIIGSLVTLGLVIYLFVSPGNRETRENTMVNTSKPPILQPRVDLPQTIDSGVQHTLTVKETLHHSASSLVLSTVTSKSQHSSHRSEALQIIPDLSTQAQIQGSNADNTSQSEPLVTAPAPPLPTQPLQNNPKENEPLLEELKDPVKESFPEPIENEVALTPEMNKSEEKVQETLRIEDPPKPIPQSANRKSASEMNNRKMSLEPYLFYSLDWYPLKETAPVEHLPGIGAILKYNRFSLVTGAGISVQKGYLNNMVLYNDYLGNYNKLDSITFEWDQDNYHLLPTYHMTETDVWDSTEKSESYQINKRYNFLRVPLLLDYNVLNMGRFNFGVRSGIEFTFTLASKALSGEYLAGNNRVIKIEDGKDELENTRLYWLTSLYAEYAITRRLSLMIEPQARYFINPVKSTTGYSNDRLVPVIRSTMKIKF